MASRRLDALSSPSKHRVMQHPVITQNAYTGGFRVRIVARRSAPFYDPVLGVLESVPARGAQPRHQRDTLQAARESKEILMNELGVTYHAQARSTAERFASKRPLRVAAALR